MLDTKIKSKENALAQKAKKTHKNNMLVSKGPVGARKMFSFQSMLKSTVYQTISKWPLGGASYIFYDFWQFLLED